MGLSGCPVQGDNVVSAVGYAVGCRVYPGKAVDMSGTQKVKPRKTAVQNCDRCVHKSVCILYYGHGQLELRFGNTYSKDPVEFINKLDERLARQCRFYLEGDSGVAP